MTFKSHFSIKLLAVAAVFASINANADSKWKDPQTGNQFWLLGGGPKTFQQMSKECRAQGWDIFNWEYLSAEEQERFLAADAMRDLQWERKFPGQPADRKEARVWGSSESGAIVTHGETNLSVNSILLQHFAGEKGPRATIAHQSRTTSGILSHAVCMYQSHTWIGCSHEIVCTEETPSGGTFMRRYSIFEYGPHHRVAVARLKDRAKSWPSVGARCELALKEPWCISHR